MNDPEDIEKIANLKRNEVGHTEENVKLKIVVPLLELLGHKREDLEFEYRTSKGGKIDIFIKNVPSVCKVIIDTKNYDENLAAHVDQIKAYTFEESAFLAILVNGSEIRIYSPIKGVAFERSLLYVIERQKLTDKKWWGILSGFLCKENLQNGNASKSVEKREQEIKEVLSSEEHLEQEYEERIGCINGNIAIKKEEIGQLDKEKNTLSNELDTKIAEIRRPLGLPFEPPRIPQKLVYEGVVPDTLGKVKIKERKVYLRQLVDAGFLKDGQTLYFYHRRQRFNNEQVQIIASSNKLKYSDGKLYSTSRLAKILLERHGLTHSGHGVAGPLYWVTEDGTLLHDLNERFRQQPGHRR